jgi:hypothetical protein
VTEEREKINAKIIDFEMNGITQYQKNILLRNINWLMDDAVARKDNYEVVELQIIKGRINAIKLLGQANFISYLQDIFSESMGMVYGFFEIIGVVLFVFPFIAQKLTDEIITRYVGGIIFFTSFLMANYRLYKKYRQ